jgi:hypothetical protein
VAARLRRLHRDVVIRPALEAAHAIGVLRFRAQHDDRQVRIPQVVDAVALAHRAADVISAHVGQHDVQEDHVGPGAAEKVDRLGACGGGEDAEVVIAEVLGQETLGDRNRAETRITPSVPTPYLP